jgi:hypothetical protein
MKTTCDDNNQAFVKRVGPAPPRFFKVYCVQQRFSPDTEMRDL